MFHHASHPYPKTNTQKKGKKEKRKRLAPTFDRQKSLMHGQITNTKKEKNM
jgi:hypothetical protein